MQSPSRLRGEGETKIGKLMSSPPVGSVVRRRRARGVNISFWCVCRVVEVVSWSSLAWGFSLLSHNTCYMIHATLAYSAHVSPWLPPFSETERIMKRIGQGLPCHRILFVVCVLSRLGQAPGVVYRHVYRWHDQMGYQ